MPCVTTNHPRLATMTTSHRGLAGARLTFALDDTTVVNDAVAKTIEPAGMEIGHVIGEAKFGEVVDAAHDSGTFPLPTSGRAAMTMILNAHHQFGSTLRRTKRGAVPVRV